MDLGIREVPDAEARLIETGLRLDEVSAAVLALQDKARPLFFAPPRWEPA